MNNIEKVLKFYELSGITDIVSDVPRDWTSLPKSVLPSVTKSSLPSAPKPVLSSVTKSSLPSVPKTDNQIPVGLTNSVQHPVFRPSVIQEETPRPVTETMEQTSQITSELASKASDLNALKQIVENFDGCSLKKTAIHTVFGEGVSQPTVLFVGEAPGEDEDKTGHPFVGVSGQLLTKMLNFIGLSREKNFYISNIIPWRPPGNRKPSTGEIALCLPFIRKQIDLLKPKVIVCLGGVSACSLLNTNIPISKLRGKWQTYQTTDGENIPLFCLYHPAFLLRTPLAKKTTWFDLLQINEKLKTLKE